MCTYLAIILSLRICPFGSRKYKKSCIISNHTWMWYFVKIHKLTYTWKWIVLEKMVNHKRLGLMLGSRIWVMEVVYSSLPPSSGQIRVHRVCIYCTQQRMWRTCNCDIFRCCEFTWSILKQATSSTRFVIAHEWSHQNETKGRSNVRCGILLLYS